MISAGIALATISNQDKPTVTSDTQKSSSNQTNSNTQTTTDTQKSGADSTGSSVAGGQQEPSTDQSAGSSKTNQTQSTAANTQVTDNTQVTNNTQAPQNTQTTENTEVVVKPIPAKISISGGTEIKVPVNGSIITAFTAKVLDKNDQSLASEPVNWTLEAPAEGVAIDAASGAVTVYDYALADTITLVASSVTDSSVTASQQVSLRKLSRISITGGVSFIVIPAKDTLKTAGFSAAVEDQNGKAFAEEKVTWSLQDPVDGVSVDPATGAVTVTSSVTAEKITLVATSVSKPSITLSHAIDLRKITSLKISGPTSILIPESGSVPNAYTSAVEDQNGKTIDGETVVWSLQAPADGVNVNPASGVVTVQNTAMVDSITLVAASQTKVSVTASVNIKLTTLDDETYDKANSIPTDGTAQTHVIYPSADQDWFKFEAQAGAVYTIKSFNWSSDLFGTTVFLYDQDGSTELGQNTIGTFSFDEWFSRLDWIAPATGTYYVKVVSYSDEFNPPTPGAYDLMVKQGNQQFASALIAVQKVENMVNAGDDQFTTYQAYLQANKLIAELPQGDDQKQLQARLSQTNVYFNPPPVTNVAFTDTNNHYLQLGGTVTWTLPASENLIDGYSIYLIDDNGYIVGDAVGKVAAGTNSFTIASGLARPPEASQLAVYAYNLATESATPGLLKINDDASGDAGPNLITVQDKDNTDGVDGRDFSLTWQVSTWPAAVKQKIFIFPSGTSFDAKQTPLVEINDNVTSAWTGDAAVTKDSLGNAFEAGKAYDVYVVAYCPTDSNGWYAYWRSGPGTITPIAP